MGSPAVGTQQPTQGVIATLSQCTAYIHTWVHSQQPNIPVTMSEAHFDEFEHYNFDQDKAMNSGHSGKQRTKKEASMNTNKHNPGGHERKIVTKLMNAEKNNQTRVSAPVGGPAK